MNQDVAFKNFFTKKSDFPKFKSKKDNKQSCRFPKDAIMGVKGNRINIIKTLKTYTLNVLVKMKVILIRIKVL